MGVGPADAEGSPRGWAGTKGYLSCGSVPEVKERVVSGVETQTAVAGGCGALTEKEDSGDLGGRGGGHAARQLAELCW